MSFRVTTCVLVKVPAIVLPVSSPTVDGQHPLGRVRELNHEMPDPESKRTNSEREVGNS
jgi:hypothetical protein